MLSSDQPACAPSGDYLITNRPFRHLQEPWHDAAPLRFPRLCPDSPRLPLTWPDGARVAPWVNPNVEFFGLDDVMRSNLNDRVPREQAKIPNARDWAVRDYGNRVGIWQLMDRPQSDQCAAADRDGPGAERAAIRATLDRIEAASRPLGWLGAGLVEYARLSHGSRYPLCLRLGQ